MAKQKEEDRVQLLYGGSVIEVKESSAQRFLDQGATKYNARAAKAAEKAADDKREAAAQKRIDRAASQPVVEASTEDIPEPGTDTVKADPAVEELAVTTDDAAPAPKEA